ncbi:MAG: hypothetical protein ABIM46_00690 [candidate division WOR-3 bacterium]
MRGFSRKILLAFALISLGCRAERPREIVYQKPYLSRQETVCVLGGTSNENGFSVLATSDGGSIVTGYTASFGYGAKDILIARLDSLNNPVWVKVIGGPEDDVAHSLARADGNGFMVVGWTYSTPDKDADILLVNIDQSGKVIWMKTLGAEGSEVARCVVPFGDGFLLVGMSTPPGSSALSESEGLLVRIGPSGEPLWAKKVSGGFAYEMKSVAQIPGNRFAVVGIAGNYASADIDLFVGVYDSLGNSIWSKVLGDVGAKQWDQGLSVIGTESGGLISAGFTKGFSADTQDVFLCGFDSSGNLLWARIYGGDDADYCFSITPTNYGFALAGYTFSFGLRRCNMLLSGFDSLGNHLWTRTIGWAGGDWCYGMTRTSEGEFVLVGRTWSFGSGGYDLAVYRVNPDDTLNLMIRCRNPLIREVSPELLAEKPEAVPIVLNPRKASLKTADLTPVIRKTE